MATAASLTLTPVAQAAPDAAKAKAQSTAHHGKGDSAKTSSGKKTAASPASAKNAAKEAGGKEAAKASPAKKPHAAKPAPAKTAAPAAKKPAASAPAAKKDTAAARPAPRPAPPAAPRQVQRPSAPAAIAATASTSQSDIAALQTVADLVRRRRASEATQAQATISDPVARKLAEWIILRGNDNGASVERYRAFVAANPSWPSQIFMRRRAEAALWDDRRDDSTILTWFQNETPLSAKGRFALARALLARGDRQGAEHHVREAWQDDGISAALEAAALEQFGPLLRPGDHKARMDILLYGRDHEGALRAAQRLGSAQVALARARIAVAKRAANAKALLDSVPRELQSDPGYIFSKVQWLRRQERIEEAGRLMLTAPRDPAVLYDLDEWWIERRVLSRELLDIGNPRMAYLVARDGPLPAKGVYKTQKEFTAGWIALRFLNDPATATQHFSRIPARTDDPTALARAGYWLGRAAEAAGRSQEARAAYQSAAMHSTSYYGQLARAKLGMPQIEINRAPGTGLRSAERFEIVRALQLLYAINERDLAVTVLADLGESAEPEVLAGLGEVASRNSDARGMLQLGKAAMNRSLPFDAYGFPVSGLPRYRPIGPEVDPSVVFAIARQESGFNPSVVSPAQAYGLMQVTPSAAKYVTRKYGATYDLKRLQSDSVYNTTLGAAELGGLLEDYRGSYVMAFAAYNAGRGSLRKWIARYGDPRDPSVDTIDWVERIPFSETRNYVQRIMENLQVYRARFGGGNRLQIEADLRRGAVQ